MYAVRVCTGREHRDRQRWCRCSPISSRAFFVFFFVFCISIFFVSFFVHFEYVKYHFGMTYHLLERAIWETGPMECVCWPFIWLEFDLVWRFVIAHGTRMWEDGLECSTPQIRVHATKAGRGKYEQTANLQAGDDDLCPRRRMMERYSGKSLSSCAHRA